jgi:hypothetical protein
MKTKIQTETTTIEIREINVPGFYKAENHYYRTFLKGNTVMCDIIASWESLGELEYKAGRRIASVPFSNCTEITKDEFLSALDKVYDSIQNMLNDIAPQEGSLYMVTPTLVPIEPPKEN